MSEDYERQGIAYWNQAQLWYGAAGPTLPVMRALTPLPCGSP